MPAILSLPIPAALTSLPPVTRTLTALLILFSTLVVLFQPDVQNVLKGQGYAGMAVGEVDWVVLVPGRVMWFPWTLVTSTFVERNFVEFLVSLFTLPLAGRYLERVYGRSEFIKFVLVVTISSNLIAVVVNVLESYVLNDPDYLYGMNYHGLMGLQIGFLVAFTQLIPEHQVQIFGGLAKMRVKSLPMLYVTVSNVACILGYQSPYILIQFGWLTSYLYLRFGKMGEGGERGDRSETFSFANWFPGFLQRPISILSRLVFNAAVTIKLIKPWTDIEQGGGSAYGGGLPGGARAEAERRRSMALKALDQRMAAKPSSSTTPPPGSSTPPPRLLATVENPSVESSPPAPSDEKK